MYTIRLHEIAGANTCDKLKEFAKKQSGSYFFVKETDANREHFQGWIRTDKTVATLRQALVRAFPENKGNKGYSLTECRKPQEYDLYLYKGTLETPPQIVCYSGVEITPETIAAKHKVYWNENEKRKKKKLCIIDELYEWANESNIGDNVEDLLNACVNIFISRRRPMNEFMVCSTVNTVRCMLTTSGKNAFVAKCMNKFLKDF